jgi:3',5'-cyclic AMP phosphodiesterase CpdA
VQRVLDLGSHRAILLDTLDGPPFIATHHSGRLCASRLAWLEQQLTDAHGLPVILFLHHPPFKVGFQGMDAIRLSNDAALLALLARFPNVVHLVCGHIHRTISGNVNGLAFTIFKSPCHQMPLDFVSPDSSLSTAEPGAYGIVLLDHGQITLHSEDFDLAQDGGFSARDALPDPA